MPTDKVSPGAAEGYWTIQVVRRERDQVGPRYVCRAANVTAAGGIAGQLTGASSQLVGYDIYRIDNPHGPHALTLALGQSESVTDAETWTVLQSARRSA